MQDFLKQFKEVQSRLAELLNTKFVPGQKDQITEYIHNVQAHILQLNNSGKLKRRDYHLLRLKMFAKHLEELKKSDENLFEDFKNKLKKENYHNYFGTRFEIDMAAFLVRKNVDFEHPDPPDFKIKERDIAIECGSGHFSGGDRTIREKIEQTVDNKSDKPYYNSNNALFIDLTNIFYHSASRESEASGENIKKWIRSHLETFNLDIGSVILFTYVADASKNNSGLYHNYLRVDNENAKD